jgi:hypothetical protein
LRRCGIYCGNLKVSLRRHGDLQRDTFRGAKNGGKGIRTPDFQLAKLALYQLSYAPDVRMRIVECGMRNATGERSCRFADGAQLSIRGPKSVFL